MKNASLVLVTLLVAASPALAEPPTPPTPPAAAATPPKEAARPAAPPTENVVRYANDKLTAHVDGIPAVLLVNEIAQQAGAKVTGTVENAQPVTADWTDLPLKDALEHILGAQNFTLTYSEKGELRAIQLRGGQQQTAVEASKNDTHRQVSSETALFKAFELPGVQVPIDGAAAKRLGRSTSPWDLLTNTSYGDDDPAVRRSAVKAGMEAFEANEPLRQSVMGISNGMSDAQLAAFARAYMYHRAEDFVRNVKRTTTMPDLRARASDVLRELRKIPFRGPIPHEGGGSQNDE